MGESKEFELTGDSHSGPGASSCSRGASCKPSPTRVLGDLGSSKAPHQCALQPSSTPSPASSWFGDPTPPHPPSAACFQEQLGPSLGCDCWEAPVTQPLPAATAGPRPGPSGLHIWAGTQPSGLDSSLPRGRGEGERGEGKRGETAPLPHTQAARSPRENTASSPLHLPQLGRRLPTPSQALLWCPSPHPPSVWACGSSGEG